MGDVEHGTITVTDGKTEAAAGETIKLQATPEEGYELSYMYYFRGLENDRFERLFIGADRDGNHELTMPAGIVTIAGVFVPTSETKYTIRVSGQVALDHGEIWIDVGERGEALKFKWPSPTGDIRLRPTRATSLSTSGSNRMLDTR